LFVRGVPKQRIPAPDPLGLTQKFAPADFCRISSGIRSLHAICRLVTCILLPGTMDNSDKAVAFLPLMKLLGEMDKLLKH
jgi:hypothetical protein